MKSSFKAYKPICEAIAALLHPNAEVVLHNLKTGCIEGIYNNLSKRKVGSESLLDPSKESYQSQDLFLPYFKTNWDGREMKCVTAVLKDLSGQPIGLLCINLDISKWVEMQSLILGMIKPVIDKPESLFKNDWKEKINLFVKHYLKEHALSIDALTKNEKQKLVLALHQEGAFETKNAAAYVADVLNISRATVYNYLKEMS